MVPLLRAQKNFPDANVPSDDSLACALAPGYRARVEGYLEKKTATAATARILRKLHVVYEGHTESCIGRVLRVAGSAFA